MHFLASSFRSIALLFTTFLALVFATMVSAEQLTEKAPPPQTAQVVKDAPKSNPKDSKRLDPEKYKIYQNRFPDITLKELGDKMANGKVILIDANREDTYQKNHLPGAYSLPALIAEKKHLPDNKNTLVVVYCGGPQCSAWMKAADYAASQGFKNIRHLSAGIKGWTAQKLPVASGPA
ncbi:rhodanese-like domain-containing protein [Parendozoicomonas haliclonae]|uniref:Molybdopterin biosynthesis protein MoeB n=1 Tax=Parendozoicomonas haliclonae TaxID=1960125 RepID=A0A1X7AG67_9GAMM|nr:rhodanese-like domain-containing protein [Parendozoicomonas haliclonae]SMA38056.1 molybdopterin biosynthesis protein MoeB [Parendozoicomonas haliclonae]